MSTKLPVTPRLREQDAPERDDTRREVCIYCLSSLFAIAVRKKHSFCCLLSSALLEPTLGTLLLSNNEAMREKNLES